MLAVRLLLRYRLGRAEPSAGPHADHSVFHPNVYLGIDSDGTCIIVAHRSEMGTSSRTSVPLILADELDADWKRVKIEQAIGDPRYGDQNTDGSHSIRELLRRDAPGAAPRARMMLIQAAAQQWGVPPSECTTELHAVVHKTSGPQAGLWRTGGRRRQAAGAEEGQAAVQAQERLALHRQGRSLIYDLADICTGKAVFGMDARMDGMVYASIEHPPVLGGKVKSLDDKEALQVAGVHQTVQIDPFKPPHGFPAAGRRGRDRRQHLGGLSGPQEAEDRLGQRTATPPTTPTSTRKQLQETARKPGKVVRNVGDVDAAFAKGGKIMEAEYYVPHAGARFHGAAGRRRRFPRRKSDRVGAHAESAGSAGHRWQTAGHRQGERDLPRHAAGRRVRAQVEAGLRGRGGGAVEEAGQSRESGLDARGRHQVRLLPQRRGTVHEGRAGRYREADGLAAALGVSPDWFDWTTPARVLAPTAKWAWASRTCRSIFPTSASKMARPRLTCASAGCARWPTSITRSPFSPSPMNWLTPPGRDPLDYLLELIGPPRVLDLKAPRNIPITALR